MSSEKSEIQTLLEARLSNSELSAEMLASEIGIEKKTRDHAMAALNQAASELFVRLSNVEFSANATQQQLSATGDLLTVKASKAPTIEVADATDLASALVLINAIKAAVNSMNS